MAISLHFRAGLGLACLAIATIPFLGCEQPSEPASILAAASGSAEKVFVVFEGPWAFAPDPKDASKILAIAPKTSKHRDLYVTPSGRLTLASGVYDLSMPASGAAANPTIDPDIARAKTTTADLERVLSARDRYAIRLPKPDAYLAGMRFRCRISSNFPPPQSAERDCVTSVSLRYSVTSMDGFSLSGTSDTGALKPQPLRVETPTVNFVLDPREEDDSCHTHARAAFHDVTTLLKVTLYVDYPDSPSSCRDKDPQKAKTAENAQAWPNTFMSDPQEASVLPWMQPMLASYATGAGQGSHFAAAIALLFGHIPTDCMAPGLVLTTGP